jgi:hypothetical protein
MSAAATAIQNLLKFRLVPTAATRQELPHATAQPANGRLAIGAVVLAVHMNRSNAETDILNIVINTDGAKIIYGRSGMLQAV